MHSPPFPSFLPMEFLFRFGNLTFIARHNLSLMSSYFQSQLLSLMLRCSVDEIDYGFRPIDNGYVTGSCTCPRIPPHNAKASIQPTVSPAPSCRFIAPPGSVKPVEPKMVTVSTACSRKATAPRTPSHCGKPA